MTISPEYAEELGRQIDELEAENERLREGKHFYADKSDMDVARHINLGLLMYQGISEQDAGFDLVMTLNDAGLEVVANAVGKIRAAAIASHPPTAPVDISTLTPNATTIAALQEADGENPSPTHERQWTGPGHLEETGYAK